MSLFTSSADTFLCSMSAWLAYTEDGCVGEREEQAGKALLLSLESCRRKSGLGRKVQKGGYPRQSQLSYWNRQKRSHLHLT